MSPHPVPASDDVVAALDAYRAAARPADLEAEGDDLDVLSQLREQDEPGWDEARWAA